MQQLFGTDGIRARFGESPLIPPDIMRIAHSLGIWLVKTYGQKVKIFLACDTRISCTVIKNIFFDIFKNYSITIIYVGIIPTSGLSILIENNSSVKCGIMISASHNPFFDNGIKIITKEGKLNHAQEEYITNLYYNLPLTTQQHSSQGSILVYKKAQDKIINFIEEKKIAMTFPSLKIILDCANGATSFIAKKVLESCGLTPFVLLHDKPNGFNINENCGAIYPQSLQKAVLKNQADCGFAFDGDGDRVIAINKFGIRKDGDDILALLACHPEFNRQQTIVGTVMSNQGLANYLLKQDKLLLRTNVGDKAIHDTLVKHNLALGGEPAGHIIMKKFLPCGDGLLTMIKIIETMIITNNYELKTFEKWPQKLINIPINQKKDLTTEPFTSLISRYTQKLLGGRISIRYSGTEPVLRIMVESSHLETTNLVIQKLSKKLKVLLT